MAISDLRIRTRFWLLGGLVVVGFAALLVVRDALLSSVRIGGPVYERLAESRQFLNEVEPPPLFDVERYLYLRRLVATKDAAKRDAMLVELKSRRQVSLDRFTYWEARVADPVLRAALGELRRAADAYIEISDRDVLPAVRAGDIAKATEAMDTSLDAAFERQRSAAMDTLVKLRASLAATEADAAETRSDGKRDSWIFAGLIGLVVVGLLFMLTSSVLRSIGRVSDRMHQMATGDGDLSKRLDVASRDEVGELARGFDGFLDKIATLVRAVKTSSIELRSAATQMAATSHEQEATIGSFGAATTEVAAATMEISATGKELVSTMTELGKVAQDSATTAEEGRRGLAEMHTSMGTLATSSGSISTRLAAISEKARDITGVVTTITKVADQTNLLSVNAAIEAEKAGESGRGFLVVAREIRRLADQTASATLDIEQTVQQMQGAVSAGVMEMDKFSEQVRRSVAEVGTVGGRLEKIIEQVHVLTDRFRIVSDGMASQAQGASQINEAMASLKDNVKQTSRSLAEFSAAADQMKSAVDAVKQEMSKFRLED
jgi:methyl-accepting chemotaxis protein WspA